jgi:GT2 family glycosyltransferase
MENKENEFLVSVIIPTYNRGDFLRDALKSVVNQTYKNLEILVIDDFSTEDIQSVVLEFNNDQRVNYVKNLNSKGPQGARNTGLRLASGEWIAMLDSDDVWLPEKIQIQMQLVRKHPLASGVGCGLANYDFKSSKIISLKIPKKEIYSKKELLYINFLGGFSTFLFKKDYGIEAGGFDESFKSMQDVDFYTRVINYGPIPLVRKALVYQRINNVDRISLNFEKKLDGSLKLFMKNIDIYNGDLKLKSRAKLKIFFYSWKTNKKRSLKYIHWVLISLLIDFKGFIWLSKAVFSSMRNH